MDYGRDFWRRSLQEKVSAAHNSAIRFYAKRLRAKLSITVLLQN